MDMSHLKRTLSGKPEFEHQPVELTESTPISIKERSLLDNPAVQNLIATFQCEIIPSETVKKSIAIQKRVDSWITDTQNKPLQPRSPVQMTSRSENRSIIDPSLSESDLRAARRLFDLIDQSFRKSIQP